MRFFFLLLIAILVAQPANALSLIRDAEIEQTLRIYAAPVFKQAGLQPENVKLFIVQDDALNAFVAGGDNIFIHTGMLLAAENPAMLIGVLAHETGHIAGGHLARGAEKLKGAQMGMILSYVLGGMAAVASGKPEAAVAVISGSSNSVQRNVMAFSRANENSADQAALTYLDHLGISASGMMQTFELLRRREQQYGGRIDPYAITHPLSSERIANMRSHMEQSTIPEGTYPKSYEILHQRMLAKLRGFIEPAERTLARYPLRDNSLPAHIARAVAYHKQANKALALPEMEALVKIAPDDPFIHELKGQILFENGNTTGALPEYQLAVKLKPDSALLLADLGKVETANTHYSAAITALEKSTRLDNSDSSSWRLLATAYGKAGDAGNAALALAEEALLQNNPTTAQRQAAAALSALPAASPARRRAEDVQLQALNLKKENEDR